MLNWAVMEAVTLRNLGKEVLFQFRAAVSALQTKESWRLETDDRIEQFIENFNAEQERFQLWAANLGLHATGDRSLDYRIQDSPSIKSYGSQLLKELAEDLTNLCKILTGEPDLVDKQQLLDKEVSRSDRDGIIIERDADSDALEDEISDDEVAETQPMTVESITEAVRVELEDISDIIDRLYRLAAKLRSSTNRAPPSARNFYREPLTGVDGEEFYLTSSERQIAKAQSEEFHFRRIEEIVRQSRRDEGGDSFPREDRTPELNLHTKAVIQRIAMGNAYRQQQFMFWRRREWERRSVVDHQVNMIQSSPMPIGPTQESQESPNIAAALEDGRVALNVPAKGKVAISEVPSATWNMPKEMNLGLDEVRSLSSKSEITMTPTVYDPSGKKVGWPTFPKELGEKKDFICPYCFIACPAKYRGKAHWRAHLVQDLQPYTCTAQVCTEGNNKLLNTWEEWIVHEQVYHRMEYTCPYHPEQTFRTREMYSEHIARRHPERQDKLLKPGEVDKNARLILRPQSGCPLCLYEADTWADMDKHLAFHLESLALLSLPLATGLESDDTCMESLQLEGGEDDMMQLLDGNAVGALSSLFATESEPIHDMNQQAQDEKNPPETSEQDNIGHAGVPYIFRIDEISEDPIITKLRPIHGDLTPPTISSAHTSAGGGVSGIYWYCDGQGIQLVSQNQLHDLAIYSVYSIYFQAGYGFRILKGDARSPPVDESWLPLRFDHDDRDFSSYLTDAGQGHSLRCQRPDQQWPKMLLPDIYHARLTPTYLQYGGLKGDLAIFLGLIAFSMSREHLQLYLTSMFKFGSWRVHGLPHGRGDGRGVVVTVYTCPTEWAVNSTVDELYRYENGLYGNYYS